VKEQGKKHGKYKKYCRGLMMSVNILIGGFQDRMMSHLIKFIASLRREKFAAQDEL
jgi:hypothetical protein